MFPQGDLIYCDFHKPEWGLYPGRLRQIREARRQNGRWMIAVFGMPKGCYCSWTCFKPYLLREEVALLLSRIERMANLNMID